MGGRPEPGKRRKHQKKEVEGVLLEAEARGFVVVIPPKGYWKVKCPAPCAEHLWQVHLTPSTPNYARNLRGRFRQCPVWEEGT